MYISHLKSGTVSGKTAGAEGRKTTLVRQFTQRVILIHELRQLGGSEELLYRRGHGFNIDQALRCDRFLILGGHTLSDHTLESGKTHAILVLQKLTHGTDTTVAQMIDIIGIANAVLKMNIITDGSKDIFLRDMLRNELRDILTNGFL